MKGFKQAGYNIFAYTDFLDARCRIQNTRFMLTDKLVKMYSSCILDLKKINL